MASYRDLLPQFSTNKHGVGNGLRGKMEMATVGYPLIIGADAQGKYFPLTSMLLSVKLNCKLVRRSHGKPHPIPVACCEVKTWAAVRTSWTEMAQETKRLPCMGKDLIPRSRVESAVLWARICNPRDGRMGSRDRQIPGSSLASLSSLLGKSPD